MLAAAAAIKHAFSLALPFPPTRELSHLKGHQQLLTFCSIYLFVSTLLTAAVEIYSMQQANYLIFVCTHM